MPSHIKSESLGYSNTEHELGMVMSMWPSTWMVETGASGAQGHLNYIEFEDSLDCIYNTLCQHTHTQNQKLGRVDLPTAMPEK